VAVVDGDLFLYDAATGDQRLHVASASAGSGDAIRGARFNPDGTKLLTFGGRSPCVRDVRDGRVLFPMAAPPGDPFASIDGAEFAPDGRWLVSFGRGTLIQVWDAENGRVRNVLRSPRQPVRSAVFSSDGGRVLSALDDGTASLWDAASGRERARIAAHDGPVLHALFSPDGRTILTCGGDRTARLWDGLSGQRLATLIHHDVSIRWAGFSPDGALAVVSFQGHPPLTRAWPVELVSRGRAERPRELTPGERARFELTGP
jgi:WD40 repeat protein